MRNKHLIPVSTALLVGLSILVISVLWCGTVYAEAQASMSMVLKNRATVSDNIVRVRDIAQMDSSTRGRIGTLVIAAAPNLGNSTVISKNEVYEKLLGNGFQIPKTQIKGAAQVEVTRKGQVIKPSYFKDQIYQYITTHSHWKDGVQVSIITAKDIIVPESGVHWKLMPANGQDFFGNLLFKIQAISQTTNEVIYSNWIVAKLRIVKSVAISNATIQKGQPIGPSDIRWEERQITVFTRDALLDSREIVGERAGRMIRPNTVITGCLLQKQYLVQRGGMAILVAQSNNVRATSRVKVLANGAYGDTVRCMNTASKRILSAVVTGKNQVEVNVQ